MAYSTHLVLPQKKGTPTKGSQNGSGNYVRVTHVITSLSDPLCKNASYLNGVYYRIPKQSKNEDSPDGLQFAFQGNVNNRTLPMEGEIVELTSYAGAAGADKGGIAKYWVKVLPVWNHPHHNAAPDTKQPEWQNRLLGGIAEQRTVNPLQANPGDTLFEGRLSQTIRFGGFKGSSASLVDGSNEGQPIIVISNGQIKTEEGSTPVEEDVNQDYNSLYFLSNHKSKLIAANIKRDSYNTIPPASNQFKGNQIILNGGRIYLNAKEDSILLSAKESVGINANTVNLDATDYFCVDGKKIFLGAKARTGQTENAVLGMQLDLWLKSLISNLQLIAGAMKSATNGGGAVGSLQAAGTALDTTLRTLETQIQNIKSNKVYIE